MGQLRIIAGCWRGRKINVAAPAKIDKTTPRRIACPPLSLRPTTDRARTTLFNWLEHFAVFSQSPETLDLYCGSGILGLEAMSRGTGATTFVDEHRPLIQTLASQTEHLWSTTPLADVPKSRPNMIAADALTWLPQQANLGKTWRLILCDPPYQSTDYPQLLAQLRTILHPEGWLYLEAARPLATEAEAAGWVVQRAKAIAHSWLHLLTPQDE